MNAHRVPTLSLPSGKQKKEHSLSQLLNSINTPDLTNTMTTISTSAQKKIATRFHFHSSIMNFLLFVESLLLHFCVTVAHFVKMVCEQICTGFDLPALAAYVWFMWIALTASAISVTIKFLLNTKNQFLFDNSEMLPNNVIKDNECIRYTAYSRLATGTEMKAKNINKKWMSTDGSLNRRALRVSCLPDHFKKMEATNNNERQKSNRKTTNTVRNKTDTGHRAVSRVKDFKVNAKAAPTHPDSCQRKPSVKGIKVCNIRVLQAKTDKDDVTVRNVVVTEKRTSEIIMGTKLDDKQHNVVNDRSLKVEDKRNVQQKDKTARQGKNNKGRDVMMKERCSGPKSKYETLKESASQVVWTDDRNHSGGWKKVHNGRRRNSSDRNTGATFDETKLSSMVFKKAAMEYCVKNSKDVM